jgi:hypothetical protein
MAEQTRANMQVIGGGGDEVQRELNAMRALADALRPLDAATRVRVLRWALEREEARDAADPHRTQPAARLDLPAAAADDTLAVGDLSEFFEENRTSTGDDRDLEIPQILRRA